MKNKIHPLREAFGARRHVAAFAFALALAFSLQPSAFSQQLIQFDFPTNGAVTPATLSVPNRQIFPILYPAESDQYNMQPGTNTILLNPGTWTITFTGAGAASYQFNVPASPVWPAANTTNNWLSSLTNTGPPGFVTFGLTTNLGVVWTNGTTLVTNQFCFTNGVLCAIH